MSGKTGDLGAELAKTGDLILRSNRLLHQFFTAIEGAATKADSGFNSIQNTIERTRHDMETINDEWDETIEGLKKAVAQDGHAGTSRVDVHVHLHFDGAGAAVYGEKGKPS